MAENYRTHRNEPQDYGRRGPTRQSEDRDYHETGDERRYMSQWNDRSRERGFEGDRPYTTRGYSEELGARRGARSGQERSDEERRGQFSGQRSRGYGEFSRMDWNEGQDTPGYYGTGRHYGSYGAEPGTRASSAGAWGGAGYGEGAFSERASEWLPETGGRSTTSGNYENYGRSAYGAQSGYGRDYGRNYGGAGDRTNPDYGVGYGGSQGGDYGRSWSGESQQSFRGRGPKGYERSDERLKEMICERLTDDPWIDASEVNIEVNQKVVKLTGAVDDRRTKYEIEELIERCGSVKDIDNQLRVQSKFVSSQSGAAQSGSMSAQSAQGSEGKSDTKIGGASATKRSS